MLHLCEDRVINGKCNIDGCTLAEGYSCAQVQPIWQKFGVTRLGGSQIELLYHDCIAADDRIFTPDCDCKACKFRNRPTTKPKVSDNYVRESNESDSDDYTPVGTGWSPAANFATVPKTVTSRKPVVNSLDSLALQAAPNDPDPATQLRLLVKYLIKNRLTMQAEQVASHFGVSNGVVFVEGLKNSLFIHKSVRDRLPITYSFHGKAYVALLHMFRICAEQCGGRKCRDPHCSSVHVCKLFVADACPHGTACEHSHDVLQEPLFTRLGFNSIDLPAHQRIELIRFSHPNVCHKYAFRTCLNQRCLKMHVCNDVIIGRPCNLPDCFRERDHNPTSK